MFLFLFFQVGGCATTRKAAKSAGNTLESSWLQPSGSRPRAVSTFLLPSQIIHYPDSSVKVKPSQATEALKNNSETSVKRFVCLPKQHDPQEGARREWNSTPSAGLGFAAAAHLLASWSLMNAFIIFFRIVEWVARKKTTLRGFLCVSEKKLRRLLLKSKRCK